MKKQMKWLLAALALAALATPAFAVNADMTGTLGVRAIATNNFDGNDAKNGVGQDHSSGLDQRFRLFTSVAANENVKAVLGLEVDSVWGRTDGGKAAGASTTLTDSGGDTVVIPGTPAVAAGKDLGSMSADDTTKLEVKHLYLDFKIPTLGANVKAGVQPFNFGRGLIINDDASGLLVNIPCPAMPDNKLELSWIKTSEGVAAETADDEGDFYGAKYTAKLAGIAVAPYAGYYKNDAAALSTFNDGVDAAFFGVDVDGKAGAFGYALTAIYNNWSNGAADGDSVSLYGKGTMGMGTTTLSLEAARMGDEKNQGGNAMSLAQNGATGPLVNVSEILTGGMYAATSAVNANVGGGNTLYLTNWMYVKAGVVQKLSDSMSVSAYLTHMEQAEDKGTGPANKAITYGQELTGYFDYAIVPGLGFNVMGSYLLADSDFGKNLTTGVGGGDNAYKLATSLNYKF